MMDEEYFRFRVEKDNKEWFPTILKSLFVLILFISIVLLTIWGYKYITKPEIDLASQKQPQEAVAVNQQEKRTLKKEELALIIKMVLEEMRKEQQKNPIKITKDTKPSEDSELLKSLQDTQVDTTKEEQKEPQEVKKEEMKKLANKKIKDEVIKKKISYNAVVINRKEVKSVDDLARLYASINKISKKKKKKILKSAYTKKITKEIVIRKNAMRTIKVRTGDTLSSIAQRAYGKSSMYKKIFDANPDLLSNPNRLKVGMTLRVPK